MKHSFFIAAFTLFFTPFASADCWKLKNGSYMETARSSSSPVAGAKRVSSSNCKAPPPTLARREIPLETYRSGYLKKPDKRECVAYVRSKKMLPPGVAYESPDSDHYKWKRNLETKPKPSPSKGFVAIINQSAAGHLAIVEEVGFVPSGLAGALWPKGIYWIKISETNFKRGYYTERTALGKSIREAENKLSILGYRK